MSEASKMKELLFELFWCGQDIQRVIFQYLQTLPDLFVEKIE